MKIDFLYLDSVTVRCPSNAAHDALFERSSVKFCAEDGSLRITEEGRFLFRRERDALYANAKLRSLGAQEAVFEADWWSTSEPSARVIVTCKF